MTDAEAGGRASTDAGRRRFSSADVLAGLGASLAWATFTVAGLGDARSAAAALVALGCASSSVVPLVVVARILGFTKPVAAPAEVAALVVLVPVALFASVLQTRTHHRALGAVAFAVGATLVFGVTFLIVRRIFHEAVSGGRPWRLLKGVLRGTAGVSVAWVLWTLVGGRRDPANSVMVDGTLGLVAVALGARAPSPALPSFLARAAPALFAAFLGAGTVLAWKNAPSFAVFCERAPVTLGVVGLFACR